MADLHSQDFQACLNTPFALGDPADGSVSLDLVAVVEGAPSTRLERFSLFFHGPLSPVYPQHLYRLEHAQLGSLDIFLVPVGPDDAGEYMQYEAVFNRFLPKK